MTYLETVKKLLGLGEEHYNKMSTEELPGLVSESKEGVIERLIMSQCPGYYLGRGNAPFKRLWDNRASTVDDKNNTNGTTGGLTGCEFRDCWSCWNEETTSYLDYFTEVMIVQLFGMNIEVFLEESTDGRSKDGCLSHRKNMVTLLKDMISYNLCVRDFFDVDMKDKKCRDGIELLHSGCSECTKCWKEISSDIKYLPIRDKDFNELTVNPNLRIRPSLLTPATRTTSEQKVMDKMLKSEQADNWTNEKIYQGKTSPKNTTGYIENPPTIEFTGGGYRGNQNEMY